jgi:CheY-like chemotaxis protein
VEEMSAEHSGITVLVVDDDIDFITQQQLQLEASGFTVVTAMSEDEARELLAQTKPDVAILDLMMENTDTGFTLCHKIKRLYPETPVIMVTAVTQDTGLEFDSYTDEEKRWVKADVMLAKPVRFEQLLREIKRLLKE